MNKKMVVVLIGVFPKTPKPQCIGKIKFGLKIFLQVNKLTINYIKYIYNIKMGAEFSDIEKGAYI